MMRHVTIAVISLSLLAEGVAQTSTSSTHEITQDTSTSDTLVSSPEVRFEIDSEFGDEAAWVEDYLNKCAQALVRMMDNPDVTPPESIQVSFRRKPDFRGIMGAAAVPEVPSENDATVKLYIMFFEASEWPEDRYRRWIIAHELVNLLANRYAGSGGFPSDFWSNGRSPFPEYVSCLLMREVGYPDDATWRRDVKREHADHTLYWNLDERHGFSLFSRFFKLLRSDEVSIEALEADEAPWPAPSRLRSLYTIAYLSIAADENLAPFFREAGVGREPADWKDRYPETPFLPYEITDEEVAQIVALRDRLFGPAAERMDDLMMERTRFRNGSEVVLPADKPIGDAGTR